MDDTPSADLPPVAMARAARQAAVVALLSKLLPRRAILSRPEDTVPYKCDRLTAYRTVPLVVVLPETEAQLTAVLKHCYGLGVPIVRIALCWQIMGEVMSSTLRVVSKNLQGSRRHAGILDG
jgi:glycolate oxidase